MKRFLLLLALLFLLGAGLGGIWLVLRPAPDRFFLPEATNDFVFAAVGLPEPTTSVETHAEKAVYPQGTKEILLLMTNRGDSTLEYTDWFDFRRVEGETITPLTPRDGLMAPDKASAAKRLEPGETVTLSVPIDLFEAPLKPGSYRAAQLACFADAQGIALSCTEISAEFTIE